MVLPGRVPKRPDMCVQALPPRIAGLAYSPAATNGETICNKLPGAGSIYETGRAHNCASARKTAEPGLFRRQGGSIMRHVSPERGATQYHDGYFAAAIALTRIPSAGLKPFAIPMLQDRGAMPRIYMPGRR
jgi:hypothetical protein